MKHLVVLNIIGAALLTSSGECSSEYIDNSRVFVEGKISGTGSANQPLELVNQGLMISRISTKNDGTFSMGGAGSTNEMSLNVNKKIEKFSASVEGCQLSYDSLSIIIPNRTNYVKFNLIELEP